MKKEFDVIIMGGRSNNTATTSEELKNGLIKTGYATLEGFDSLEAAEQFTKNFPKYVKLKAGTCSCTGYKNLFDGVCRNEKYQESKDGWASYKTYILSFDISGINQVTGEANEQGQKRINKLIQVLKNLGYLE
jgi:hypothetical protein